MKAVNLIPSDARGVRVATTTQSGGLVYSVIAILVVAVALATIDVLTTNTINDRKTKLAAVQADAGAASAEAARLASYTQFAQMAQERAATVRDIAAARFDWHGALDQLSQVVPTDVSLQTLNATVAPGAGGGGGSSLRGDIASPALEMTGCTRTQDDVAGLMSRLRTMTGVTRVSLESSVANPVTGQSGASASSGSGGGCPSGSPTFNMVLWYQPLPSAGPEGVVTPVGGPGAGSAPPTNTTAAGTTTPISSTTTGAKP
jgi:Tfp pilus assembly protein PilN